MNPEQRLNRHIEFRGSIVEVRAVEDSIRKTGKYTKGVFMKTTQHPLQGEDFPSKVVPEYYEVYPTIGTKFGDDMPFPVLVDWLIGEVPTVIVRFTYYYQSNRATVIIPGGIADIAKLSKGIAGFEETLKTIIDGGNTWAEQKENAGKQSQQAESNRSAISTISSQA